MSRISVSALHYMTRMANFHCKFSLAFNTLPNEVNDENEKKVQATFDLISDYADFVDHHIINIKMHPSVSKSDPTFTVIDILRTKINRYQKTILDKTKTYKNVNIVVLEP
jgi:hypothetical protein